MTVKRIVHIIENMNDDYGGPAKSVPHMIWSMNQFEIEQYLISCRIHPDENNEFVRTYGINHLTVPQKGPSLLRYSPELKQSILSLIANSPNSVMHIHNLWNYVPYTAWKVHKQTGCPFVISPRGSLFSWCLKNGKIRKKIALNVFQSKMLHAASAIHVTSKDEGDEIRNLGYKNPIEVVPNGIDLNEFQDLPRGDNSFRKLNTSSKKKYLLFMSRIDRKKGLDILLKSFLSLQDRFNDWNLIIAGPVSDENYWRECNKIISDNASNNRIKYLGMLDKNDRIDAFSAADIFVLPSHSENFGVVILEALAAGLPVLTTKNTPWRVIDDNHAGIITDPDVDMVTEGLLELMSLSDKERLMMSFAARKISTSFSSHTAAQKMLCVYRNIFNAPSKSNKRTEY